MFQGYYFHLKLMSCAWGCKRVTSFYKCYVPSKSMILWTFHVIRIWSGVRVKYIHCVKSVQIRSIFWVFSCIRIEYGELFRISPYSVRMRENMDQKKLCIWELFMQWFIFKIFQIDINYLLKRIGAGTSIIKMKLTCKFPTS